MSDRAGRTMEALTSPETSRRALELRAITPGQRWKLRRDLVIYSAVVQGFSHRLLADVFDLPHSRISAIVKKMRQKYENKQA